MRILLQFHNQRIIKENRDLFIKGKNIAEDDIRDIILQSWERSKIAKIDPYTDTLAQLPTNKIVPADWIYKRDLNRQLVFEFYDLIDTVGCACYILNTDLTILIKRGNEKLLNELSGINFDIGANLNENLIGTNATALASFTKKQSVVVGAEHYINALQNFISIATPGYDENENIPAYLLLMAKLDSANNLLLSNMNYYQELIKTLLKLHLRETELIMANELLNLNINQKDRGYIYVDHRGYILKCNHWILNTFDVKETDLHGKILTDPFPQLVRVLNSIRKGENFQLEEIYFDNLKNNKAFFVECQPIKIQANYIGTIINLFDSKHIHNIANKLSSSSAHFTFKDLIGSNKKFIQTKLMAENFAWSNSNVLITGESGTGKELFAQSIHNASPRRNGPFISINCGAIPKELIGSELFGYVEGAFTGARKGGAFGKFELANNGTIFLDEIGEMPLEMQSVLLRVLEEKKITKLGGSKSISVDVKVIAATNKNLQDLVNTKKFRLDLYYRLNILNIDLVPLRKRKDDISILIEYFLNHFNSTLGKNIIGTSKEVMHLFMNYPWPGNVRELRNVIERGVNLCQTNCLSILDIPNEITGFNFFNLKKEGSFDRYNSNLLDEFAKKVEERRLILDLMKKHAGNKSRIAIELGISRATLYKKRKDIDEELDN